MGGICGCNNKSSNSTICGSNNTNDSGFGLQVGPDGPENTSMIKGCPSPMPPMHLLLGSVLLGLGFRGYDIQSEMDYTLGFRGLLMIYNPKGTTLEPVDRALHCVSLLDLGLQVNLCMRKPSPYGFQ